MLVKSMDNSQLHKLNSILKELEPKKEKANDLFKKGHYDEALTLYGELLELDPDNRIFNSTILANRALCKFIYSRLSETK